LTANGLGEENKRVNSDRKVPSKGWCEKTDLVRSQIRETLRGRGLQRGHPVLIE